VALDASETRDYVRHRLRMASGGSRELFSESALREVHRHSGGVPRLVNLICDRALLAGYASGESLVGADVVAQAAQEILGTRQRRAHAGLRAGARLAVAAVLLCALALVGAIAWQRLSPPGAPAAAAAPAADEGAHGESG
jgi:general secretion pathway protein A